MATYTPLLITTLVGVIREHFSLEALDQAVQLGLGATLQQYASGGALPDRILTLCRSVNAQGQIPALITGLRSNPSPRLNEQLDAFLAGPITEDDYGVMLVTQLPPIPMIDRVSLRGHLQSLLTQGAAYRAVSVEGPTASGKSHSAQLIRYFAAKLGATAISLQLVDGPRTLSLQDAMYQVALVMGRTVTEIQALAPDDPTDAQIAERFVAWLAGVSRAASLNGEQYWIILDGLDRLTAAPFRELLVPRLLTAAVEQSLHNVFLFLLGDNGTRVQRAQNYVLHEDATALTESDIKLYVETFAATKGIAFTGAEITALMKYIIGNEVSPFDHQALDGIVRRLTTVLKKLSNPGRPATELLKDVL